MTMQALDKPTLYFIMAVGLVLTMSGLYFIFKHKDDENAARIELFGLKFQSSSAGTLVVLLGAAFLVVPLFAPRASDGAVTKTERSGAIVAQDANDPEANELGGSARLAVMLPATAGAEEQEPNDQLTQSNQFEQGFGVKGSVNSDRDDHNDWYVVDVSSSEATDFTIKIRNLSGGCIVYVYDQDEQEIGSSYCNNNGGSKSFDVFARASDLLFFRVTYSIPFGSRRGTYELFVQEK